MAADLSPVAISAADSGTRRHLHRTLRLVWLLVAGLVVLAVLALAALKFIDSERGHALLLRQLPGLRQQSGLTIAADRIDGSLFGRATLHGLRLGDPQGVFATLPLAEIDWRPLDLLENGLTLRLLTAPELRLLRLPKLRPSGRKRLLPDIDIVIGTLRIDRLVLDPPVIGRAQTLALGGSADIRSGRAKLDLSAAAVVNAGGGGDIVRVHLDAEPDRDRFDVATTVTAPKQGVITTLLGLAEPLGISVKGDGTWSDWRGTATATLGARQLTNLALSEHGGAFTLTGTAAPALLLDGMGARLSSPSVALDATARLSGRTLAATLHAASPALRLSAHGGLDFAAERFEALTANAEVLRPAALDPRITGKDIRLAARIGGSFAAPLIDYTLTSPAFNYGRTGFSQFRAVGVIAAAKRPFTIPVTASAARLSGVGETGAALLANLRIAGPLVITRGELMGTGLTLRSERASGTGNVALRLADGNYVANVDILVPRYLVAGLGSADIAAKLHAVPGNGGARVTGSAAVAVTRLDNAFFAKLLQGLPRITTNLDVAPDLSIAFADTRLTAPGLTLAGAGSQSPRRHLTLRRAGRIAGVWPGDAGAGRADRHAGRRRPARPSGAWPRAGECRRAHRPCRAGVELRRARRLDLRHRYRARQHRRQHGPGRYRRRAGHPRRSDHAWAYRPERGRTVRRTARPDGRRTAGWRHAGRGRRGPTRRSRAYRCQGQAGIDPGGDDRARLAHRDAAARR